MKKLKKYLFFVVAAILVFGSCLSVSAAEPDYSNLPGKFRYKYVYKLSNSTYTYGLDSFEYEPFITDHSKYPGSHSFMFLTSNDIHHDYYLSNDLQNWTLMTDTVMPGDSSGVTVAPSWIDRSLETPLWSNFDLKYDTGKVFFSQTGQVDPEVTPVPETTPVPEITPDPEVPVVPVVNLVEMVQGTTKVILTVALVFLAFWICLEILRRKLPTFLG